ncbi:MAG: response regulator [Eubacteriales bacterium]|nr:response regulator [Eubacteriales bacterium]
MSAYRILLVDDEEEVRRGIIRKTPWEDLGFSVAGDAENGEDAMEKIEQLEPDVVMTDIRMPYMDGLTLTARIRQKYPSIKVLIFSGFDDFEYAQQAIKLNVAEYILKPVNMEELSEILTRVKKNLDEEIKQRRDVDLLRESYRSSLPILREVFLTDLVRGIAGAGEAKERMQEYGIDILGARKWVAALIHVDQEEGSHHQPLSGHRELIPISVRKLVEDNLKGCFRFTIFNSATGITLIAAIDQENSQTVLIDQLGDICKEARRILEVTVTIAVGHSCASLDQLSRSYQSAVDALGYRAIAGAGSTIYINDVEPVSEGKLQLEPGDESELTSAVKFGPEEKIRSVVEKLVSRMGDARVHARQYQLYMLSIIGCITKLMQQYDMTPEDMFHVREQYMDILSDAEHREEFEEWVLRAALQMHESMNKERDKTARRAILEAKRYIQENYQNPDLSVEMICRLLHMSPAYFSTMFRRETGQTYVAYLTEIRLNRAVELLNETDDKTYVIAQKVGYQEQNYFSYVFKKRFGVSPTRYRGTKGSGA